MGGRKPAVAPSKVIDAILHFKNRVIYTDVNGEIKIQAATNNVWEDISQHLNSQMTKNALHIFVQQDRHNMKSVLGISDVIQNNEPIIDHVDVQTKSSTDSDSSDDNSIDGNLPSLKFVFTFSAEEWKQIQPEEVKYKVHEPSRSLRNSRSYYVLRKGCWTTVLAEHFWIHTSLPCCISFKRGTVLNDSNIYIKVIGRCTTCGSIFKGIVPQKPTESSRVLMECEYVGKYDEEHVQVKKRRMIGPTRNTAFKNIIDEGKASETYREIEAVRLMRTDTHEPAIIPTGNALRTLKWRNLSRNKRHKDVITSLALMKNENEFKNILHDMGSEPFFLHYHCPEQIHVYRSYTRHSSYPKLIIDATGSVIKNFEKFGIHKTKSIYLYEALVYDETKHHSFTVSNMISERHNTLAIFNWLAKWLSNDVSPPKEVVCDQSVALMSAIVQCFTQYSSLNQYLLICAELTLGKLSCDSHWLPNCFLRSDVAHFVKLVSKWVPLKSIPKRVREVILRSICAIIKRQCIKEIHSILLSLFIVLTNETDGADIETGQDTPCEKHKKHLLQITSSGFIDFEQQFNEIMAECELEDNDRTLLEQENTLHFDGLDCEKNPFKNWAEDILKTSQEKIREGCGYNAMYLPSIVPLIIKSVNLLPLWSGLMIPIFKYGNPTSSSASVESSFKKLKTVTFKDITLPTNIEVFLERHIISLKGSALFRSATHKTVESFLDIDNVVNHDTNKDLLCIPNKDNSPKYNQLNDEANISGNLCENEYIVVNECNIKDILNSDNEPTRKKKNDIENNAEEFWNRSSKKQRCNNSYLIPNTHLRHLNLNNSRNIKSLPVLKNGSRANELKSCNLLDFGRVVLSNTCAFDAIASIFMVSYCDSQPYSEEVDQLGNENNLLGFISSIVKTGITASTYKERAEMLIRDFEPEINKIEYNLSLVSCHATAATIVKQLCLDVPTVIDYTSCSNPLCENVSPTPTPVPYITFHTFSNNLDGLQEFLLERFNDEHFLICGQNIGENEFELCNGEKTIKSVVSKIHLVIEILKWEGEGCKDKNQTTEAAPHLEIKLKDIPPIMIYQNTTYELRGVCAYRRGLSRLRTSVGHYTSWCKRGPRIWEMYDDLKSKSSRVKEDTEVACELVIYTI